MTVTEPQRSADPAADQPPLRSSEAPSRPRRPRWLGWLRRPSGEALAAILLAVAALATAWSSYQASVWSGIQSMQYSAAGGLRTRATRAADKATQQQVVDVILFTKWLEAQANGQARLGRYYRDHFRAEFRPVFEAWWAAGADRAAATTPFERPEYSLAAGREAERLDDAASSAAAAGERANDVSDGYVFDTVILASVLFFAGAVRPLASPRSRGAILFIALLLCIWALLRLVNEPVAKLDPGARLFVRTSAKVSARPVQQATVAT
jgi:hypothetical protein